MTFVKHTCGGGAAITPAGLVLSGLDEHELLELHTLNGAIVIFGAGTERLERAAIAYELVRMAEAIMTDVLAEQEEEPEEETIPLPCEALSRAGLDGDEIHVICDEGIVMIVGTEHEFSLSHRTRERLHKHGITPGHFDCLFKRVGEVDD